MKNKTLKATISCMALLIMMSFRALAANAEDCGLKATADEGLNYQQSKSTNDTIETAEAPFYNSIDFACDGSGTVQVSCTSEKHVKVGVKKDGLAEEFHDFNADSKTSTFPLTDGEGVYTVSVYENINETSYRLLLSESADVTITSEHNTYLVSNNYASFDEYDRLCATAREITKDASDSVQKAYEIYLYIADNFEYDDEKAELIVKNEITRYIPSPEETFNSKKGVCCDLASLYAAMLRSVGVSCKVVVGNCEALDNALHAWNLVYDESLNDWIVVDVTRAIEEIRLFNNSFPTRSADSYCEVRCY